MLTTERDITDAATVPSMADAIRRRWRAGVLFQIIRFRRYTVSSLGFAVESLGTKGLWLAAELMQVFCIIPVFNMSLLGQHCLEEGREARAQLRAEQTWVYVARISNHIIQRVGQHPVSLTRSTQLFMPAIWNWQGSLIKGIETSSYLPVPRSSPRLYSHFPERPS